MEWSIEKMLRFPLTKRRVVYRAVLSNQVTPSMLEAFGTMTQEEAEAVAKLLNASQPY